ncbi:hypothetical protein ACFX1T_023711 [Malus domestica]
MQQCRKLRFGHRKMSDVLAHALNLFIRPKLETLFDKTPNEFDSFEGVLNSPLPEFLFKEIGDNIPAEMLKENFRTDGAHPPIPNARSDYRLVWRCDA